MKCPICAANSRVLETRTAASGYVLRRRRVCDNEHAFATHEVDDSLSKTVVKFAMRAARIEALRARAERWRRNARIVQRAARGEKHSTIASDCGLADNMVSHVVKHHR